MSLQGSYDRVAEEYGERISDELQHKPLDRFLLDQLAAWAEGIVCDMGCGPGHVARYLKDRGADVCGVDLSAGMVEEARRRNPDIPFQQGDMLSLEAVSDEAWGGIAAFYSLIHIPRDRVVLSLRELRRVLRPGGLLLVAFHLGEQMLHLEEWWGHTVSVDFLFFTTKEMRSYMEQAELEIEMLVGRSPYPRVEHPSHRGYLLTRKSV